MQKKLISQRLKSPPKTQGGFVLMLMTLIFVLVSASVFISVLSNNNQVDLREGSNTTDAMSGIKETLISYSVLYADYYGAASAGPGHLMCPDTDGDGVEDEPCATNSLGRLPTSMILPSGDIFPISDYQNGIDQQVWYALSDNFRRNPAMLLNSSSAGNLTLDGQGGIAAILIAPNEALVAQNRASNASADYLEAGNIAAPTFVTNDPLDPNNFNDRLLPIRITEVFTPVTARVAEVIRIQLDDYHAISGNYPLNQNDFDDVLNGVIPAGGGGKGGGGKGGGGKGGGALNPMPVWFINNDWASVSIYNQLSNDSGTVSFTSCNIVYTLNFALTSLGRAGVSC